MNHYGTILAIVDHGAANSPALLRAAQLARAAHADLHCLVLCAPPGATGAAAAEIEAAVLDAHRALLHARLTRHPFATLRVRLEVAWQHERAARFAAAVLELQPDLVVEETPASIGQGPGDLHLRGCAAPLLLARAAHPTAPTTVVAAIDIASDDPPADAVVAAALRLAQASAARVELVHVLDEGAMPAMIDAQGRAAAEQRLHEIADRHHVLHVQRHVLVGNAAAAILEFVDRVHADVLVMGARVASLGTTIAEVLAASPCDVLAVPAPLATATAVPLEMLALPPGQRPAG